MARIRILQPIAGTDFSWAPGEIITLPDDEAAKWADGHRATYADDAGSRGDGQKAPEGSPTPTPIPTPEPDPDPTPEPRPGQGAFDPGQHTVREILAHLQDADEGEVLRVLEAETAGEGRRGVLSQHQELLDRARARQTQQPDGGEQATAEKAAQASRGGGRSEDMEIR